MLLLTHALPAAAYQWTEAELKAVPAYCQARYGAGKASEAWVQWAKTMGPHSVHMHHYCDGLLWMNRYYAAVAPQQKKRILQSAYGSFMYMVQRVDGSWPLQAELYLNLGTVLGLQNKDAEALAALLKAIELDPKLARAYSATANHYVKLKKQDDALKTATEGLRQVPGNAALQRSYVKLGGQLPYPEPAVQEATQPKEGVAPAGAEPTSPAGGAQDTAAKPQEPQPPKPAADTASPPKIGSPSNPWCRFCPPEPGQ